MKIIENNFFFLDSDSLDEVKTRLYGYSIANEISGEALTIEDPLFPLAYSNGAYVLVQNCGDEIQISQDFNGAYGIYFYRQEGYFALSNSFLLLLEKLDGSHPLTFNLEYANAYIATFRTNPYSCCETLVNEIEMLPRDVKIIIQKGRKEVRISKIDYHEHSENIATVDGLRILDQWYFKWTCIIRAMKAETDNIVCDLSGGYDSRVVFGLFANAGIDLNEVSIRSKQGEIHTFIEDYEVAAQIAEYYSISLNKGNISPDCVNLKLKDCINISAYTKLGAHKQMYWITQYSKAVRYHFTGSGGECLRTYDYKKPKLCIENECKGGKRYRSADLSESVRKVVSRAFEKTIEKFQIVDKDSIELTRLMFRETEARHHFGKRMVESHCGNDIIVSPLMDVTLACLYNQTVQDEDLLYAVIFTRYFPELLKFSFEGGREINPETLKYAKGINDMMPFCENAESSPGEKQIIYLGENSNCIVDKGENEMDVADAEKFIYDVFASDRVRKAIVAWFHEDIYAYADTYVAKHAYHPLWQVYPIIGAYLVQDVIMNRGKGNYPTIYERMQGTMNAGPVNPDLRLKDDVPTFFYLFPFGLIPRGSSIILYGAGKAGTMYYEQIKKSGYCNIVGWVDRNYEKKGVQSPETIENKQMYDYIVIAVVKMKDVEQIRISLLDKGVDERKIIWRNPEYVM